MLTATRQHVPRAARAAVRGASAAAIAEPSGAKRAVGSVLFGGLVLGTAGLGTWQVQRYQWKVKKRQKRRRTGSENTSGEYEQTFANYRLTLRATKCATDATAETCIITPFAFRPHPQSAHPPFMITNYKCRTTGGKGGAAKGRAAAPARAARRSPRCAQRRGGGGRGRWRRRGAASARTPRCPGRGAGATLPGKPRQRSRRRWWQHRRRGRRWERWRRQRGAGGERPADCCGGALAARTVHAGGAARRARGPGGGEAAGDGHESVWVLPCYRAATRERPRGMFSSSSSSCSSSSCFLFFSLFSSAMIEPRLRAWVVV